MVNARARPLRVRSASAARSQRAGLNKTMKHTASSVYKRTVIFQVDGIGECTSASAARPQRARSVSAQRVRSALAARSQRVRSALAARSYVFKGHSQYIYSLCIQSNHNLIALVNAQARPQSFWSRK